MTQFQLWEVTYWRTFGRTGSRDGILGAKVVTLKRDVTLAICECVETANADLDHATFRRVSAADVQSVTHLGELRFFNVGNAV